VQAYAERVDRELDSEVLINHSVYGLCVMRK
jgi:hypothetical protein